MSVAYEPGNLVKARGREWVILPESTDGLLMVRPIGGLDDEVVGICTAIEQVDSATFSPPDHEQPGDFNACRLLRDAARIATRSAAGPFRCFGKIAVEPRPYQLVPLLLALRSEIIRILIADDVGIGKTIEAGLIAKELIERGEVTRLAVLCPPHLAEQWQKELKEKFHIEAQLVLSGTVQRLERHLRAGESLFDRYPYVIVSTDFIKSLRHRDEFIAKCPELVIVDEAHTCTLTGGVGRSRQARYELIRDITADAARHLILVTATPHSGNEDAFRSLVSLLDAKFKDLPDDLGSNEMQATRRKLSQHLVQRLRGDIKDYLGSNTKFPDREDADEESYKLSKEYRTLFNKVLNFVNEMVSDPSGTGHNKRVRWWSALALLRALASSPAAAAATLRNRAITSDARDESELDELARRAILDQDELETSEIFDAAPGAVDDEQLGSGTGERLKQFAREAEKLSGKADAKLQKAIKLVKKLIEDGYHPILFCRFIDTAEYVAEHLRAALKGVEVDAVTGLLPPSEREDRIQALGEHEKRVLVCTDCLSEGINLQDQFSAVFHYDLSWNPTRHEQREGRVDRFGQPAEKIRVLTYFGVDNQIDGVILNVLLRKHKSIKSSLGISVAVPGSGEDVIKAIFEGMQLRDSKGGEMQMHLPNMDPVRADLDTQWENARDKEKRSRSRFAQHTIKVEEVEHELEAVREAIGSGPAIEQFVRDSLHLAGVTITDKNRSHLQVGLGNESPRALRHAVGRDDAFVGRFELPVDDDVVYLSRTHPIVEGLASYVLESALDEVQNEGERPLAARCGVTKTKTVTEKTQVLLVRFRFHLHITRGKTKQKPLLAEEVRSMAFTGSVSEPKWLEGADAAALLSAVPSGNLPASLVKDQLEMLVTGIEGLAGDIDTLAQQRADALCEAHTRVRKSARISGKVEAEPVLPADILGAFILIPDND